MSEWIAEANRATAEALVFAEQEAGLTAREMELEHSRPVRKHEAILRIMERQVQPSGKPHSYSSAEALATVLVDREVGV